MLTESVCGRSLLSMEINIGQIIGGRDLNTFNGESWLYLYEVTAIEHTTRFGKPCRLLSVTITTSRPESKYSEKTRRWETQLF